MASSPATAQSHSPIAAPYSPSDYSNANYAQSDVSGLEDTASSVAPESSVSMWDEGRDASLLNRPRRTPTRHQHQHNDGTTLSPVDESGITSPDRRAIDSSAQSWQEKRPPSLPQQFPPPPRRNGDSRAPPHAHHQPTHPLSSLAHTPASVACPHCHNEAPTRTEQRRPKRSRTWLCCCFAHTSSTCDTYHRCAGCGATLVIVAHDGQVTVVPIPGAAGGVNIVQLPAPVALAKKGGEEEEEAGRESREYRSELEGCGGREIKEADGGIGIGGADAKGGYVKELAGPPVEIGSST